MDYAKNIVRQIILEEVHQDNVIYAIKKRHGVAFRYDSGDGDSRGKGDRMVVIPVAYGTTKAGNYCFRAYQVNGSSESAEKGKGWVPGWRLFLLNRVVSGTWKDSGIICKEPPGYNPNGDGTMVDVLVKADFKGSQARYERGGLKRYNDERHRQNVEKNPLYDFQRNIKRSYMASDQTMKNIADTQKSKADRDREWDEAYAEMEKGNASSINDMAKQKDFGNDNYQQTIGPQRKGQYEEPDEEENTPNDYSKAMMNGPRYK